MKKLIATIALSSLALIPATAAWAGGDMGRAVEQPSVITSLRTTARGDGSLDREWAMGCWHGVMFVIYVFDDGHFWGRNLGDCPMDDWIHFA